MNTDIVVCTKKGFWKEKLTAINSFIWWLSHSYSTSGRLIIIQLVSYYRTIATFARNTPYSISKLRNSSLPINCCTTTTTTQLCTATCYKTTKSKTPSHRNSPLTRWLSFKTRNHIVSEYISMIIMINKTTPLYLCTLLKSHKIRQGKKYREIQKILQQPTMTNRMWDNVANSLLFNYHLHSITKCLHIVIHQFHCYWNFRHLFAYGGLRVGKPRNLFRIFNQWFIQSHAGLLIPMFVCLSASCLTSPGRRKSTSNRLNLALYVDLQLIRNYLSQ